MHSVGLVKPSLSEATRNDSDYEPTLVWGVGPERCSIIIIGEAPGAEEDRQGLPFVGQSGQLLRKVLAEFNLDPAEAYITNVYKYRPPDNRKPTRAEIGDHWPLLEWELKSVQPTWALLLGDTAARTCLNLRSNDQVRWGEWYGRAMPVWHPSYVLRNRREESKWKGQIEQFLLRAAEPFGTRGYLA